MRGLWSLGGLTWRELLLRTARESWQDNVFGIAARLAFYHFVALFPSLLLLFLSFQPGSAPESAIRGALEDGVRHVLPARGAALIAQIVADLHRSASQSGGIWAAIGSALWASINGAYALIDGLNLAYEVEERRSFFRVVRIALAITAVVAILTLAALVSGQLAAASFDRMNAPALGVAVRWLIIAAALFICFAIFFRIAPNLKERQWQWSTPGAVVAAIIWIGSTIAFRFWTNRFDSYPRIYGRVAPALSLLIWLYVTGATVLIGGELNSEIEKAAVEGGRDHEIRRKK